MRLVSAGREAAAARAERRKAGLAAPSLLVVTTSIDGGAARHVPAERRGGPDFDLDMGRLEQVLAEAASLGIYFCALTGRPPLIRRALLDAFARFPRMVYLPFCGASEVEEVMADRLGDMPNVVPILALDATGSAPFVVHSTLLRVRGVPFGFWLMARRPNLGGLMDESLYEQAFDAGAGFGLVLEDVASRPDGAWAPLLFEEREALAECIADVRSSLGRYLTFLPWDERREGGCQAASDVVHLNALGQLEPCPFVHFSPSHGPVSLKAALDSPLFEAFRGGSDLFPLQQACPCWYLQHRWIPAAIADEEGGVRTDPLSLAGRPAC